MIIHHTVSSRDRTTVDDINEWHRYKSFKSSLGYYVGYHFVITGDGKITQCRGLLEDGAHTRGQNHKIGVVLTGNFEKELPSMAQIKSLLLILKDDFSTHKDYAATLCPGKNLLLVLTFLKYWLRLDNNIRELFRG